MAHWCKQFVEALTNIEININKEGHEWHGIT